MIARNSGSSYRGIVNINADADEAFDTNSFSNGDILRIEADGSSHTLKINGSTILGPTTSTHPTGTTYRRGAIRAYSDNAANNLRIDTFSYGDISVINPSLLVNSPLANQTTRFVKVVKAV